MPLDSESYETHSREMNDVDNEFLALGTLQTCHETDCIGLADCYKMKIIEMKIIN